MEEGVIIGVFHSLETNILSSLRMFFTNINVITGGISILAAGWFSIWALYRSYLILAGLEAGSFIPIFKDLFIKMIIVVGVATAPSYYQEVVADLLIETTTNLGKELSGTNDESVFTKVGEVLDRAVEGLTVSGTGGEEEEEEDPDASIWVKGWNWLVKKAKGIWHVVNYPFSVVADYISTITKLFIIAAGASYLAVVTFFTVMTSKIFAFASLTMGPLFVFFAAFEKTRSWFSSWLSSTIGYLFTFVTVMLVWGFLLNVFKDMFYVNAENPLTWGATFKCLFACLFFGKIMDKVGDLASNWFGTSNVTGGANSSIYDQFHKFKGRGRKIGKQPQEGQQNNNQGNRKQTTLSEKRR